MTCRLFKLPFAQEVGGDGRGGWCDWEKGITQGVPMICLAATENCAQPWLDQRNAEVLFGSKIILHLTNSLWMWISMICLNDVLRCFFCQLFNNSTTPEFCRRCNLARPFPFAFICPLPCQTRSCDRFGPDFTNNGGRHKLHECSATFCSAYRLKWEVTYKILIPLKLVENEVKVKWYFLLADIHCACPNGMQFWHVRVCKRARFLDGIDNLVTAVAP